MPTILVVDDEQVVRRWVVMTISTLRRSIDVPHCFCMGCYYELNVHWQST